MTTGKIETRLAALFSQASNSWKSSVPLFEELMLSPKYSTLSLTDMALYSLYFSRTMASAANAKKGNFEFVDSSGEVFCIFTAEQAAAQLHVSTKTVSRTIKALKKANLIRVKRTRKVNRIYVMPLTENVDLKPKDFLSSNYEDSMSSNYEDLNVDLKPKDFLSSNFEDFLSSDYGTKSPRSITKESPYIQSDSNNLSYDIMRAHAQDAQNRHTQNLDRSQRIEYCTKLVNQGVPQEAVQQIYSLTTTFQSMHAIADEFWKAKSATEKKFGVSLVLEEQPSLTSGLPEVVRRTLTVVQTRQVPNPKAYIYTCFKNFFEENTATLSKAGLLAPKKSVGGTGKKVPLMKVSDTSKL